MTGKSFWFLPLLCFTLTVEAKQQSFRDFIQQIQSDASEDGISQETVQLLSQQSKPFKKLGTKKTVTPEGQTSLGIYFKAEVPDSKIDALSDFFSKYRQAIFDISEKYHVQPRFILASWALASSHSKHNSSYPALSIYSSMAFESDEQDTRKQLISVLKNIDAKKIAIQDFKSDAKGRMGQLSYTPILFAEYAQDWDKDGKYDIWQNNLDSLATVAHFLSKNGWQNSMTWGRQVALKDKTLIANKQPQSLRYWAELGITKYNGSELPNRDDVKASFIQPLKTDNRHYLTYGNFEILKTMPDVDQKKALAIAYLSEKLKPILRKK